MCIHISPPSWASLPTPSHSSRSLQSTEQRPLCYTLVPTSYLFCTWQCTSIPGSLFIPLPTSWCPHIHSLCICLDSCPANRLICTIFLDTVSVCIKIWYLFFSFWLLHSVLQTLGPSTALQMTQCLMLFWWQIDAHKSVLLEKNKIQTLSEGLPIPWNACF